MKRAVGGFFMTGALVAGPFLPDALGGGGASGEGEVLPPFRKETCEELTSLFVELIWHQPNKDLLGAAAVRLADQTMFPDGTPPQQVIVVVEGVGDYITSGTDADLRAVRETAEALLNEACPLPPTTPDPGG